MPTEFTPEQIEQKKQAARDKGVSDSDIDSFLSNNPNDYDRLATAFQPTDYRSVDSQSPEGDQLYGSGSGNATNTPKTIGYQRDGGEGVTDSQLNQLLDAVKGINSGPDVDLSGIQPEEMPTVEVPGENLSPAIDNTLMDLMEGQDPMGLTAALKDLMARTKGGGVNSQRLQTRNEMARENLTRGEEGALADLRSVLADRGLVSLPGAPEGAELDATSRAFLPLQREFLQQTRQSELDESMRADEAETSALAQAMGWSDQQAAARLAAAGSGTERQKVMADLALESLRTNMDWNKYLADFGLKREQVENEIRSGRITAIAPILQMIMGLLAQSRGGYVGG